MPMRDALLIVTIIALLLGSAKAQRTHDLMIVNASAPASLVPTATAAAVYFSIMNHGTDMDRLVGVATSAATSAVLHESYVDADIAKMRTLAQITVPAGGMVEMKQGGLHVMLTGLKKPLKQGDVIELELLFDKAGKLPLKITVGKGVAGHQHGGE